MSKVDEMFKELGYTQKYDGNDNTEFYKYESRFLENDELVIVRFYKKYKGIYKNGIITIKELQSINEKVKELRMDRKIREEK